MGFLEKIFGSYSDKELKRVQPQVDQVLALPENQGKLAFLGRVKDARFKRQVVPGDVVELECRLIRQKSPVGVGECVAKVDGQVAVTAELTFAIG